MRREIRPRKFYRAAMCGGMLLGTLLGLLTAPAAWAQAGQPGVVEKYRLQKNADPAHAEQWAFCAALAYAREHYSPDEFRNRARNLVASLKQVVADSSVCPCEDAMPLSLWYGKNIPPRSIASRPVLQPVWSATGLPQVRVPLVPGLRAPRTPAPVTPEPPALDRPAPGAAGPSAPGLPVPVVPRVPVAPSPTVVAKGRSAPPKKTAGSVPTGRGGGAAQPGLPMPPPPRPGMPPAGTGPAKQVYAFSIPDFTPSISAVISDGLRGSHHGVYVAFLPNTDAPGRIQQDPLDYAPTSHVHKLVGSQWVQSTHQRPLLSFFPATGTNEKPDELSYLWSGPMTGKEALAFVRREDDPPMAASMYGHYNINNSLPSFDYQPPAVWFKLVVDHSERFSTWGLGAPPFSSANIFQMGAPHLYISSAKGSRSNGSLYEHYDLSGSIPDLEDAHLEPSDLTRQAHAWVGAGRTLVRAELDGSLAATDLTPYGAKGSISKMRCSEGILWVLCGNDLFRVAEREVTKFCTIQAPFPSFAVDKNYLYTNDGYKTSLGLKQRQSFMGTGGAQPGSGFLHLKAMLGLCQIECTTGGLDGYVYVLSSNDGKIYKVDK